VTILGLSQMVKTMKRKYRNVYGHVPRMNVNRCGPEMNFTAVAQRFDASKLHEARNDQFNPLMRAISDAQPPLKALTEDFFVMLFRRTLKLKDEKMINPLYHPNRNVVKKISQTNDFKTLHRSTSGDPVFSSFGAVQLMDEMIKNDPNTTRELTKRFKQQERLDQQRNELREQIHEMNKARKLNRKLSLSEKRALRKQVRQFRRQIDANQQQSRQNLSALKQAQYKFANFEKISAALKKVNESIEEQQSIQSMMPGTGLGVSNEINDPNRLKLAYYLQNPKVKKILEALGKLALITSKKVKSKVRQPIGSTVNITIGNELDLVLPSEFLFAFDQNMEILFIKKFLERELLQFETELKTPAGKGPFIICLDNSGSMNGRRDTWAKAISLAFLNLANMQRRHVHVILFTGYIQKEFTFSAELKNYEDIYSVINTEANGGTNFHNPLERAFECIQTDAIEKESDILFITDGEAYLSNDFIEEIVDLKKKHETQIVTVIVQGYFPSHLEEITDEKILIEDLTNSTAEHIISTMI